MSLPIKKTKMENDEATASSDARGFIRSLGCTSSDARDFIRALGFTFFPMAVTGLIAFFFFTPHYPEIYVSRFNVSSDGVFTVNLTFLNPNKDRGIIYYDLHAALICCDNDRLIAETSLSPFEQKTGGDVTALKAKLPAAAAREYCIRRRPLPPMPRAGPDDDDDEGYRSMRFGVRVFLITKYPGLFNGDRRYLKAYCGDVGISLNYTMPCTVGTAFTRQS